MSNGQVTKDDLWDLRDTLVAHADRGFGGVNVRLDKLNGRVGEQEKQTGIHQERIAMLRREMDGLKRDFHRRRRSDWDAEEDGQRGVTERDVRLVVAGVLGTIGVVSFFWKVLPWLLKALA